jgi:hypothetical protein
MNDKLEKIFRETLKEANKEKVYKGGNPNSLAAWIYTDISSTQNGRVLLDDKYENFEWDQNKSNQNIIKSSNTGSGEGKGFSFYFARYAYNDNYKFRDKTLSTNIDNKYSGFLSIIDFDFLTRIVGNQLLTKLNPKNRILLIIDEKIGSRINIISANYTTNNDLIMTYVENETDQIFKDLGKNEKRFREELDNIQKMVKYNLMQKLKNLIIEGTKEFEKLLEYYN